MTTLTHGPIIGAITDHSATIWVRADGPVRVDIRLLATGSNVPILGGTVLDAARDFTGTITFRGLAADAAYHYEVLLDGVPAPLPGALPAAFVTFPERDRPVDAVSFAFGSCFIPQRFGDTVFASLSRLQQAHDLRFFMMIGDNVYVDDYVQKQRSQLPAAPVGEILPLFREAYRDAWAYKNFRATLKRLPAFMIFDDHEFWNNWGQSSAHRQDPALPAALRAYWEYQDSHNPDAVARHSAAEPRYDYAFAYGDLGFFVLDCRSQRRPDGLPFPTLIGEKQRVALFEWLRANNDRYRAKFIISSVPVAFIALPHWLVRLLNGTLGDQWLGYRQERAELFKFIQQEQITGVHFLSGDIHLGQGIQLEAAADQDGPPVYAYTASPLAQTIWLLGDDLPSWSSKLAGFILGVLLGIIAGRQFPELAAIWRWLIGPLLLGLVGTGAGALARSLAPASVAAALRRFAGNLVFYPVKAFAQLYYLYQIRGVSGDLIADTWSGKTLYRARNLFRLVTEINVGVVHVRQKDSKTTVQFELYDEQGQPLRRETAHTV